MKATTLTTMSVQLTIANDLAWTVSFSGSTAPPLPSIRVRASGENSVGMTGEGQGLREPSGDERGCVSPSGLDSRVRTPWSPATGAACGDGDRATHRDQETTKGVRSEPST